ncbi:MAG TPA: S1C family serine protease [Solirubrobacteraceae bacterium]|jgi:S1-C subfamily serine protease|nr:S1C family serine protease [Solirubrobacteraceae bacterium]
MSQVTVPALALAESVVALGRGARRGCGLAIGSGHVVTLAARLVSDRVETLLPGQPPRDARVIGIDRALGVAVLDAAVDDAPAVRWAETLPQIDATVFALGDPGTGLRVTQGSVSAGPLTIRVNGRQLEVIEHTAPMPRGAGGGPLVDDAGAVLGLNALLGDPGFLFALPSTAVRAAIGRVLEGRHPPTLGVALIPPAAARKMRRAVGLPDRDGLLVRAVQDDSPAAIAGVLAGDLIVRLDDVELRDIDDLYAALDARTGAASVDLRVVRAAAEADLTLPLSGGRR